MTMETMAESPFPLFCCSSESLIAPDPSAVAEPPELAPAILRRRAGDEQATPAFAVGAAYN